MNFYLNIRFLKNIAGIIVGVITVLYFLFSILHRNSLSWSVYGTPYLSLFLVLFLIKIVYEYNLRVKKVTT